MYLIRGVTSSSEPWVALASGLPVVAAKPDTTCGWQLLLCPLQRQHMELLLQEPPSVMLLYLIYYIIIDGFFQLKI